MKVLSVIFGVIMVMFGIGCTFTPLATFVGLGFYIAFLILIYGVLGLINGIASKSFGIHFVFSIISLILGIIILSVPGVMAAVDGMLVYLAAFWFLLQGIMTVYLAFAAKKAGEGAGWIFLLIFGILGVILGITMIANPGIMMIALGFMVGIEFAVTGFDLITIGLFA